MAQDSTPGDVGPTRTAGPVHPPPAEGWTVLSHLLSGFLVFGGIGWALDALFDVRWFLLVGLLAGGAASFGLIYIRYVYIPPTSPGPSRPPVRGTAAEPRDRKEHG